MLAKPMNIYIGLEEILDLIKCIVDIYREHGNREKKSLARFKWLVKERGIQKIKDMIEERMGKRFPHFDTNSLSLEWKDHGKLIPEFREGFYSLVVPCFTGTLNIKQFKRIIDIEEKFGDELRVSPLQKLVLINIPEERLSWVKKELRDVGLDTDYPKMKLVTTACPTNFCGKFMENVKLRALEIEDYLERVLGDPFKKLGVRFAVSGCPNGCAQHMIADIGLQATIIRVDGKPVPAYDIYLRGRSSKLSRIFLRGIAADEVKQEVKKIVEAYLRSGSSDFGEFVDKLFRRRMNYEG